uniref:Uncharacterized protein n=1 Tax=Acrobeloides nanus TaxID=290746 RepID=A0A914EA73_9BILA
MMRITPENVSTIQIDSDYSFQELYCALRLMKEKEDYMSCYCKMVEDSKREFCISELFINETKIVSLILHNYAIYLDNERYGNFLEIRSKYLEQNETRLIGSLINPIRIAKPNLYIRNHIVDPHNESEYLSDALLYIGMYYKDYEENENVMIVFG